MKLNAATEKIQKYPMPLVKRTLSLLFSLLHAVTTQARVRTAAVLCVLPTSTHAPFVLLLLTKRVTHPTATIIVEIHIYICTSSMCLGNIYSGRCTRPASCRNHPREWIHVGGHQNKTPVCMRNKHDASRFAAATTAVSTVRDAIMDNNDSRVPLQSST